ncbi:MAG: sulfite exporter TauE/SafE family protein [Planctomycetota bacterium]|jgi:sulfite exporter TauE/SafE/copper chaperone CopZ|nr:sulfite exporter TauE/SafE family protein [Planctomycetota bacterium]
MVCQSCGDRIEKRLTAVPGVAKAKADRNAEILELSYDPEKLALRDIGSVLDEMGYELKGEAGERDDEKPGEAKRLFGLLAILLGGYLVLGHYGLLDFLDVFPEAEAGMGYGMIFVVGLLTSAHCVAMCGGINLSQSVSRGTAVKVGAVKTAFLPAQLYGIGRMVSYSAIGALAGGLGSIVSFSGGARGIVQMAAGGFMMLMGLNLTGIFPSLRRWIPRLPRLLGESGAHARRGPFIVGLLNGLMPCGPLQTMQLFALSTGDPVRGALAMMFFALGTLPLTVGMGVVAAYLGRRFMTGAIRVGAVLVFVMGVGMLVNGLRLSGFSTPNLSSAGTAVAAQLMGDTQVVKTELDPGSYQAIRVRAGVPLRWNVHVGENALNGCNNRIVIPAFGIEKRLVVGDNIIAFTPTDNGVFPYTCWMGMIASRIVVGDIEDTGVTPEFGTSALPIMKEDTGNDIPWL